MATLLLPAMVESFAVAGLGTTALMPGATYAAAGHLIAAQVAGGLIDSLFIFPKVFGQPASEGPRLGDLHLQDHTEGSPQNRVYGATVPVAGTLVWATRLREVKDTSGGGGKGGSGGSFLVYKYFVSAGIQFARGEIAEVRKVWADGKVFFDVAPDFDESSDQVWAETDESELYGGHRTTYLLLKSDVDVGGPDFSDIRSGKSVLVSGFTGTAPPFTDGLTSGLFNTWGSTTLRIVSATGGTVTEGDTIVVDGEPRPYVCATTTVLSAGVSKAIPLEDPLDREYEQGVPVTIQKGTATNNGQFKCVHSAYDPDTHITTIRLRHHATSDYPFAAQAIYIDTISVFQSQPTHKETQIARISFQTGTDDQEPDALLIEHETQRVGDSAQVYACRGRVMMWLEDMEVTDFGNRIPNFEGLLSVSPHDDSLATAISQILRDKGLEEEAFDVSGVSGTVGGYAERGPQAGKKTLQPLLTANQITARDENGVLIFQDRDAISFVDLDADASELGVHEPDSETPLPVIIKDSPERSLPRRIDVQYIDADNDYQTGSRHAKLSRSGTGETATLDFPLVMTKDEAQQIADRSLALAHATRRGFRGTFLPSMIQAVKEGGGATLKNVHGRDWPVLISAIERGANLLPTFEAIYEDPEALLQEGLADGTMAQPVVAGGGGVTIPGSDVLWNALDIPALRDEDADQAGRYIVAANADQDIDPRGFILYESVDGGLSFRQIATLAEEGCFGDLVTAPSITGVLSTVPDTQTTYRVRIFTNGGQPSSVTLQDCAKGRNRFLIGDEILGAPTVTLVSTDEATGWRTYDLSGGLLRGLADTGDVLAKTVGDRVVWLDGPGVHFVPMNVAAIGHERRLKIVAHGGNPEEAFVAAITADGRNVQPYRVVQVHGDRDGSDNLTLRWQRQTRAVTQWLDQAEPLGEDEERYRVEILDGADVLRSFETTESSQVYTAAQQTADGLTPGDDVDVRIYQRSKRLHWGRSREETV